MKATKVAECLIYFNRKVQGKKMDNLRLNIMLYYVQGLSLAANNRPIFSDSIEAWKMGPVVREVYDRYKTFGKNEITVEVVYHIDVELANIITMYNVVLELKDKSGIALMHDIRKNKNNPWVKAHSEYEGKTVSNDDIKQFFSEEYKIHTVGEKLLSFATQEPAEIKEDKLYVHSSFLEE